MIKLHVCVYYVTYDDPAKPDCFNDSRKCNQTTQRFSIKNLDIIRYITSKLTTLSF